MGTLPDRQARIHRTACVEEETQIGPDVEIGPYAVIMKGTILGAGVRVGAHSVLGQRPTKAKTSSLRLDPDLPGLSVGSGTVIGVGAGYMQGRALAPTAS